MDFIWDYLELANIYFTWCEYITIYLCTHSKKASLANIFFPFKIIFVKEVYKKPIYIFIFGLKYISFKTCIILCDLCIFNIFSLQLIRNVCIFLGQSTIVVKRLHCIIPYTDSS